MKRSMKFYSLLLCLLMALSLGIFAACDGGAAGDDITVTLDKATHSIKMGETAQLTATVKVKDVAVTDETVTWGSSDETKATVADGLVTAVAEGSANITATVGDVTATCELTVTAADVLEVTLDKTTHALKLGTNFTLVAAVELNGEVVTDKTVVWDSSDKTKATVANGVVTTLAGGNTNITATVDGVVATCAVTVANVVWTDNTLVIPSDIAAYNADRVERIDYLLANAVIAVDHAGNVLTPIVGSTEDFTPDTTTKLIAQDTYKVSYMARVSGITFNYERDVTVVAPEATKFMVQVKQDRSGKATSFATKIGVESDMFFEIPASATELPSVIQNKAIADVEARKTTLFDPLDPFMVYNNSGADFTLSCNDDSGVVVVFSSEGKVIFSYEGVMKYSINTLGQVMGVNHKTGATKAADLTNMVIPNGAYVLVIGASNTQSANDFDNSRGISTGLGNMYEKLGTKGSNMWDFDGRQYAYSSVGYRIGNMVKITNPAGTLLTPPYVAQAPYMTQGMAALTLYRTGAAFDKTLLLSGVKIFGDKDLTTFVPDTEYAAADITVEIAEVVADVVGEYSGSLNVPVGQYKIKYSVKTDAGTTDFLRDATVVVPTTNFIKYTVNNEDVYFIPPATSYNPAISQSSQGDSNAMYIFDNTYNIANFQNLKLGNCEFIVIDADGKLITTYLNRWSGDRVRSIRSGTFVERARLSADTAPDTDFKAELALLQAGELIVLFGANGSLVTPPSNSRSIANYLIKNSAHTNDPALSEALFRAQTVVLKEIVAGASTFNTTAEYNYVSVTATAPSMTFDYTDDDTEVASEANIAEILTTYLTTNNAIEATITKSDATTLTKMLSAADFDIKTLTDGTSGFAKDGTITFRAFVKGTSVYFDFSVDVLGKTVINGVTATTPPMELDYNNGATEADTDAILASYLAANSAIEATITKSDATSFTKTLSATDFDFTVENDETNGLTEDGAITYKATVKGTLISLTFDVTVVGKTVV